MTSVEREMESAAFGSANLYYVRVRVPLLGLGTNLDEIIQFYWERGEELRAGYFDKSDESQSIYFCFCEAVNADDFARHFNGEQFRFPFEYRNGERSRHF